MGKGAARSPEKLSAEELEERRQKRREEQLGTKSDACFPLERRASLTLSPYVKFKAAVPTQNLTHPMTKRFPPKGTRGRESVLEAEEGRCQAERDREEGGIQRRATSKYKIHQNTSGKAGKACNLPRHLFCVALYCCQSDWQLWNWTVSVFAILKAVNPNGKMIGPDNPTCWQCLRTFKCGIGQRNRTKKKPQRRITRGVSAGMRQKG